MGEGRTTPVGVRARARATATRWLALGAILLGVTFIVMPTAPASAEGEEDPCAVQGSCVSCEGPGPLELSAGPDQTVLEWDTVQLAGVASGLASPRCDIPDPAVWSQVGGTTVTLSDTSSLTPTFSAPDVFGPSETLTFRLSYEGEIDDVDILVEDPCGGGPCSVCEDDFGTPSAGDDRTVLEGATVQLDGIAATDGPFCGFAPSPPEWSQIGGPTVTLSDSSLSPSFTAPAVTETTPLTFRLTYAGVSDDIVIAVEDVPAVVTTPTTPTTAAPTTTTTTTTAAVQATPKAAETTSTTAAVLAAQTSAPLPRTGVSVTWTVAVGVLLILLGAGSLASASLVPAQRRPRQR